jgi:TonB family protein
MPSPDAFIIVDEQPVLLRPPEPVWPRTEVPHGGTVVIKASVGTDGLVCDTRVLESSGILVLDQAAVRAALLAEFRPARKEGQAVGAWVIIPMGVP